MGGIITQFPSPPQLLLLLSPPVGILISYVNIWGDVALCCRGWVRSPPFSLACVKNLKRRREGKKKKKKHDLAASLVVPVEEEEEEEEDFLVVASEAAAFTV